MIEYSSRKTQVFLFSIFLLAPFLGLCYKYFGFTIDDSFIAWRYSKNLVNHGALTWNPGKDPVEGFTSFLWVILNAGALSVGISPVVFSKGLSILSVLVIVVVLLLKGTEQPWYLQLGLPAALALSPAVAVLAVQGLETIFTALLLLGTSIASVRLLKTRSKFHYILFYTISFISGLARPDSLVFILGVFVTTSIILFIDYRSQFEKFIILATPFVLLGISYMLWRIYYFGYLFPNPTQIKVGGSLKVSIRYVYSFFSDIAFPYILFLSLSLFNIKKRELDEVLPILSGLLVFSIYLLNVTPIQGFLWRYAMPVLPSLLYACLHLPWSTRTTNWTARMGAWTLGTILLLWPLQTYFVANEEVARRPPDDRIAVGKALQGIDGRLFTSESGALAYYSEWQVVDLLGLNSEKIAHGTSRREVLQDFNPDVISLLKKRETQISESPYNYREMVYKYIKINEYVAVYSTVKTESQIHVYFVNKKSDLCRDTILRLLKSDTERGSLGNVITNDDRLENHSVSNVADIENVCISSS
jgi:hypothetical protein